MSRESDTLFDGLAAHYDEHFAVPHRRAYDLLAWELTAEQLPASAARILDVGCGTGRWARELIDRGYQLTGIEPAPAMAALALEDVPSMRLVAATAETADLPAASFDAALAMGSLQYCDDPVAAFARVHDWLVPGGCSVSWSTPASRWVWSCFVRTASRRLSNAWTPRRAAGRSARRARRCICSIARLCRTPCAQPVST